MLSSCQSHALRTLQVRNLPDGLHGALAAWARAQSVSASAYVIWLRRPEGSELFALGLADIEVALRAGQDLAVS